MFTSRLTILRTINARQIKQAFSTRIRGPVWAIGVAAAFALPASAVAADALVKPGLWEFSTKLSMEGLPDINQMMAQLSEQMKQVPPEMREMLNQQMAAQGMAFGPGNALQVCITPEDAAKADIYAGQQDGDCSYSNVKSSKSNISADFTCQDPKFEGSFKTVIHSATHFTTTMEGVSDDGPVNMETSAKFLNADCGMPGR